MGWGALTATAVAAALIFVATARATRAAARLSAAALTAGVFAAAANVAWDIAAFHAGWWHYGFARAARAPLLAYLPVAFVYGGALGLIGWRVIHRFGAPGAVAFFAALTAWGMLRDHLVATYTPILVFGPEPWASLADGTAYLSLAVLVQAVLRAVGGGPPI